MFYLFFFMMYQHIVRFYNILKSYSKIFIKKDIIEISKMKSVVSFYSRVNEYIKQENNRFISTYEIDTPIHNINLESIFYNYKEYNNFVIKENNELENIWKTRILYEHTPIGNIIMFYNIYKKGYAYYSDVHMTYTLLNAVAMKYVRIFCCRDLFIDDNITPKDYPSPFIKLEEIQEKEEEERKNENNSKNKTIRNGPFIKIKKKIESITNEELEKPKQDQHLYNVNKFIYMGKISNFSFLQKIHKKKVIPCNQNQFQNIFDDEHEIQKEILSYSEYRKLQALKS